MQGGVGLNGVKDVVGCFVEQDELLGRFYIYVELFSWYLCNLFLVGCKLVIYYYFGVYGG